MWVNDEASVSLSNEDVNPDGGADEWGVSDSWGRKEGVKMGILYVQSEVACG